MAVLYFKNYEYFLAIAESGSLTKAAESLYISQPALSRYLGRLEENLGVTLFDRSTSPLTLTYFGEKYLDYLKKSIQLEKTLEKDFSSISSLNKGKLVIGTGFWRSSVLLPAILPKFEQNYPNIDLKIVEGSDTFLENELLNDRLDFCIMNQTSENHRLTNEIIFHERILLAIHINSPVLTRHQIPLYFDPKHIQHFPAECLNEEKFILSRAGQKLTQIISGLFNSYNIQPGKVLETSNITTAMNLVEENYGITFIPESCLRQPQNPEIIFFTVGEPVLQWSLSAVYKSPLTLSIHSRNFIDFTKNKYSR